MEITSEIQKEYENIIARINIAHDELKKFNYPTDEWQKAYSELQLANEAKFVFLHELNK